MAVITVCGLTPSSCEYTEGYLVASHSHVETELVCGESYSGCSQGYAQHGANLVRGLPGTGIRRGQVAAANHRRCRRGGARWASCRSSGGSYSSMWFLGHGKRIVY